MNNHLNVVSRINNFDLVRLFASIQVLLLHTNGHLKINSNAVEYILNLIRPFPGVPIFFTISGFLIYNSLLRASGLKQYYLNRALRIFPLLFASSIFLGSIIISFKPVIYFDLIKWFLGQITFFQYYTPSSLRIFGVGTPNGALWTIPVEIQFYLLLPIVSFIAKTIGNWIYGFFAVLSIGLYSFFPLILGQSILLKLIECSIFFYFIQFSIGIYCAIYFDKIKPFVEGKFLIWLFIYILYYYFFDRQLHLYHDLYNPNHYGLIACLLLSGVVLSAAFSMPELSSKMLKGQDLSYGTYVFHMIVVNVFIELGFVVEVKWLIMALAISCFLAFLSWNFIEEKALKLKTLYSKRRIMEV